jgi:hypothetical protein
MPQDWSLRLQACFTDARPVLDVKYDIEKRVNRLLPRDPEHPGELVFRAYWKSYTTSGGTTVELRLAAAYGTHNLFALQFDADGAADPKTEKTWEENLRVNFNKWTSGLALTEDRAPSSPDHYRQVVEETIAREAELANYVNREDDGAIRVVQEGILDGLRHGKSFFTANKEGGTHIRFLGGSFVLQDYGESNDREEFGSAPEFLARLRKFYAYESSRDWSPHAPPEIEVWRYIERKMRD